MRHGFILIIKPVGPTSHDVVAMVRNTLHERAVGHLGTLDPIASGLLVLAVGSKALKTIELFQHATKQYIADATLGATSTTYDREGMITDFPLKKGWEMPKDIGDIQTLLARTFVGRINQVPPAFSAIKIGGERAYRKARQGIDVSIPPREVEIFSCDVLAYDYPHLRLKIACSSGTYVRTLIDDIGKLLRCGAYMKELRRTHVAEWSVDDAVEPEKAAWGQVIPMKDLLGKLPRLELNEEEWEHIKHGRSITESIEPNTIAWFDELPCALLEDDPKSNSKIKARKVF